MLFDYLKSLSHSVEGGRVVRLRYSVRDGGGQLEDRCRSLSRDTSLWMKLKKCSWTDNATQGCGIRKRDEWSLLNWWVALMTHASDAAEKSASRLSDIFHVRSWSPLPQWLSRSPLFGSSRTPLLRLRLHTRPPLWCPCLSWQEPTSPLLFSSYSLTYLQGG